MMKAIVLFSSLLLVTLALGCAEEPAMVPTTEASVDLTPEQLGAIGSEIRNAPDQASEILSRHGLTEETFEAEVREVTEDPEASRRYATALETSEGV